MTDTADEDVMKLAREMREGLEGVTPGPWVAQGDGYDTATYVMGRDIMVRSGAEDRIIAVFHSYRPNDRVSRAFNAAHAARCSPDNIRSMLDHIDALTTDRAASAARVERLERSLGNLAHEMRFLLRNNPKMDGGLYRQRLTEAETILGLCHHNCDEGGVCLAGLSGVPDSCPLAARSALEGK